MKIIQLAFPYDPEEPADEILVYEDGTTPEEETDAR